MTAGIWIGRRIDYESFLIMFNHGSVLSSDSVACFSMMTLLHFVINVSYVLFSLLLDLSVTGVSLVRVIWPGADASRQLHPKTSIKLNILWPSQNGDISQTSFSTAFSCMNIYEVRLIFYWNLLFTVNLRTILNVYFIVCSGFIAESRWLIKLHHWFR